MSLWGRLKGAVKMAFEKEKLDAKRIIYEVDKFLNSSKHEWMQKGIRYYDVENDRLFEEDKFARPDKADIRLVHATYKNIVDEKVGYAFSKTPTLSTEDGDEDYIKLIKKVMGKYWDYEIESLAFEASNKGIGWIQPYINEKGEFKMFVPPAEQIIPIWVDSSHFRLTAVIRFYKFNVWRLGKEEEVTNVELWTKEGVQKFRREGNNLIQINDQEEGHFNIDNAPSSWGKVPFIPFKNNRRELPDLKFVKTLVDNYDLSRSEVANYIQEVKNFIMVLKGYDGESLQQLIDDIYRYRTIILDEDGDFDTMSPKMDITSAKEHFEQLKQDILESGQAVNRNLDRFGSAPSGIALEFLFSGLELKCNAIESEFRRGFDGLLYFVNKYLEIKGNAPEEKDVTIEFNHDMTIDETAIITNIANSRGVVSDKTLRTKHPYVTNPEDEENLIQEQKESEERELFDRMDPKKELEDEAS